MTKELVFFTYGNECRFFGIHVDVRSKSNVFLEIYELEEDFLTSEEREKDTGDKLKTDVNLHELIIEIDVWSKYYFPVFVKDNENQWYHRIDEDETCYMEVFYNVMKYAYSLAVKAINVY
jgi:hypothetical protein